MSTFSDKFFADKAVGALWDVAVSIKRGNPLPLDKDAVIKAAKKTGCIVTAEEHNIIGGLGSAVAEAVAEECPVPVIRVGVNDEFGKSGPAVELLHLYGLDAENIVKHAKIAISKK